MAFRIESFFTSVAASASELDGKDQAAILARLARAREMFGGIDALRHFYAWKTPEER